MLKVSVTDPFRLLVEAGGIAPRCPAGGSATLAVCGTRSPTHTSLSFPNAPDADAHAPTEATTEALPGVGGEAMVGEDG
jgi:hypothetical protein